MIVSVDDYADRGPLDRAAKAAWLASLKFYHEEPDLGWEEHSDHFHNYWRAIALAVRNEG